MSDSLEVLNLIRQRPLLTADEERQLIRKMRQGGQGAIEARERLTECNTGLVISIARSFCLKQFTNDLISEGMVGLMRAMELFNPDRGIKFSTYATHCIRGTIGDSVKSFHNNRNVARLPTCAIRGVNQLNKLIEKLPQTENDIEALVAEFGVRRETMEGWMFARSGGLTALSLDAPLTDESGTFLKEIVPEKVVGDGETELIGALLGELTEQEAKVFRLRYLEEQPLHQIATSLNLSIGRVREIHDGARTKLRKKFPTVAHVIIDP